MKLIPLSKQGKNKGRYFAQVDDEDYEYLNQFNWKVSCMPKTQYAMRQVRKENKKYNISMHREIMGLQKYAEWCDHIDGNGLNNQRSNLRKASPQENQFNRGKIKNTSSKYKGVHCIPRLKDGKIWNAKIMINRRCVQIGRFITEEDAALAYNNKAIELFGEFAKKNLLDKFADVK